MRKPSFGRFAVDQAPWSAARADREARRRTPGARTDRTGVRRAPGTSRRSLSRSRNAEPVLAARRRSAGDSSSRPASPVGVRTSSGTRSGRACRRPAASCRTDARGSRSKSGHLLTSSSGSTRSLNVCPGLLVGGVARRAAPGPSRIFTIRSADLRLVRERAAPDRVLQRAGSRSRAGRSACRSESDRSRCRRR